MKRAPALAHKFLKFVDASPSPFHATNTIASELEAAGFERIKETDDWRDVLKPNGLYYFTRNQTTICSFAVGGEYVAGQGVNCIASHVDSPCPRVKPRSNVKSSAGDFLQLGVHLYGGGLWDTWFDRELGVAGRVITKETDGSLSSKLVHVKRPIVSIPNLCIHLTPANQKTNKEKHVLPILATALKGQLEAVDGAMEHHHPVLLDILSKELQIPHQSIVDFELSLFSTQPSAIGGAMEEFIYAPRLDNLMGCFTSLHGYLNSLTSLSSEKRVRMFVCFDHEEVGSVSAEGAASSLVVEALTRVVGALSSDTDPNTIARAFRRSFITSNDMAHAIHPNYPAVHEKNHRPQIHQGLTIKTNVNQRYATNGVGTAMFKQIAANRKIPLQEFVVPNDSRCGSTIGPKLSATSGIRTIDVGMPQLSMHSVREMCGTDDVVHSANFFQAFFEDFTAIDERADFN